MPGITISASYGAGGSVVGPRVAERLRLQFIDRAISSDIAAKLHVSVQEAEGGEISRGLAARLFGLLAPLAGGALGAGTDAAPPNALPPPDDSALFRQQADTIMRAALDAGVVILGRAGAAALRDEPKVLRVRLFGPQEACIEQGARLEHVDVETARIRQPGVDRARAAYVRRLYGVDVDDPAPFLLQIDSTALPLDACVEIIATAYTRLISP
jgi:cytidylate kinase